MFDGKIAGLDPSQCFEEVVFALHGNSTSLPQSSVVGGGKIPGCKIAILFDRSSGEFEISWQNSQSCKVVGKCSLFFRPDDKAVNCTPSCVSS